MSKVSIVIPAYNEEKNLGKNLRVIFNSFPKAEIIVVNDGSTDKSDRLIRKYANKIKYFSNEKNMGKSFSIRKGVMKTTGDVVIFTDADLPFGIEGIRKIINSVQSGNKIVITEKIKTARSLFYITARFFMRKLIRILFGFKYKDTQAGLKGFEGTTARKIYPKTFTNRFAGDIEVIYLAKLMGVKIESIPMNLIGKKLRVSHFNLKQEIFFLIDLIKIRTHKYEK